MNVNLAGQALGNPITTEKGFIQKLLVGHDVFKIFSKTANSFNQDEKGNLAVKVQVPDFVFVAR